MPIPNSRHILVAPLDWGLGHTARCVPIIRHIAALGHIPVVAGNEWQRSFIKKTFGHIDFIHLEGYNVTYSKKSLKTHLLRQFPGIKETIRREHAWLTQIVDNQTIDGIISDNRYGLHHPRIPSVILTHQLNLLSGLGKWIDSVLGKWHYRYLNAFSQVWVPDVEGSGNLSGILGHPKTLPGHTKYIGLLSRFEEEQTSSAHIRKKLLILLSGPEPQRTILSDLLWQQAATSTIETTFIEGNRNAPPRQHTLPHVNWYNIVSGDDLATAIKEADIVICRSGYSSLMDLVAMGKKAIIIPTPGQTEQEYLAKYLQEQKIFMSAQQHNFDLPQALKEAGNFPYSNTELPSAAFTSYRTILSDWIDKL